MLCFRDINCAVKVMVKFVSSKEMLRNTEEFVRKGTYKTVCHRTPTPISFSFKAKFINVISSITIIVFLVIRMLRFKRHLLYGFCV